jgi:uncharacterized membrane protein YjfL (UPF0719 family)
MTTTATTTRGARWLARAGMLLGLGFVLPATIRPMLTLQPSPLGMASAGAFTASALAALWVTVALWNQLLLRGRMRSEIGRGNPAAGIAASAHAVGTGIVAGHCFAADALANLAIGAAFFAVAVVALLALSLLFRALTDYADDQEILGENSAAAVSYAGIVVALSVIVGHAADGAFVGWIPALRSFAAFLLWAVLLYPVRQVAVGRLLLGFPLTLRGGPLDHAIACDRDWVVSCVEAIGYLVAALFATGLA